jgi:hypothetical protein
VTIEADKGAPAREERRKKERAICEDIRRFLKAIPDDARR